jgi:hypothetical protein
LARDGLKSDENFCQTGNGPKVISFDFKRVMLLPKLTTGIVYYKRQVSSYNLGIRSFSYKTGTMHVWDETISSRGRNTFRHMIPKKLSLPGPTPVESKRVTSRFPLCGCT